MSVLTLSSACLSKLWIIMSKRSLRWRFSWNISQNISGQRISWNSTT